jgi:hypothetical protein
LEEGSQDYDFFGIGSGNVFPFSWFPLDHYATGEEILFNQHEELAHIHRRGIEIS